MRLAARSQRFARPIDSTEPVNAAPPSAVRGAMPSAVSSPATSGSRPGAATAKHSSASRAMRAPRAPPALLGIRERARLCGTGNRDLCSRRSAAGRPRPKSQRADEAFPDAKAEEEHKHQEVHEWKERVLLHRPQIVGGPGDRAEIHEPVKTCPPRTAEPAHGCVRRRESQRKHEYERGHADQDIPVLCDLLAHRAPVEEPVDADPHAEVNARVEEREEAEHAAVLRERADTEELAHGGNSERDR